MQGARKVSNVWKLDTLQRHLARKVSNCFGKLTLFYFSKCLPIGLVEEGVSVASYAKNLRTVLAAAQAAAGRVVFVTTTPFHQY